MLWKCCTQYASKFGKLSSSHRTGKGQFSSQSQRKAMPKNAQTTAQWHSSHMLVKWCLKSSKPGFSNTWTMNFQMFKLDLEMAEEPEIKLPTSAGSSKKQEISRRTSISALLIMPKSLTVFSSVQLLSRVWLFEPPWTTAQQASLSITNCRSTPKPCPSSRWCHSTILSSVIPFSSCPQSFPASGSFQMSQL